MQIEMDVIPETLPTYTVQAQTYPSQIGYPPYGGLLQVNHLPQLAQIHVPPVGLITEQK